MNGALKFARNIVSVCRTLPPRDAVLYIVVAVTHLEQILRTRTLVPADKAMGNRNYVFQIRPDLAVTLQGEQFSGGREMYARKVYFACKHVQLKRGDVVVDLGANRGLFTTMASQIASTVVAVEAQSGFLPEIRANLQRNVSQSKVHIVNALIGERAGVFASNANRQTASHWQDEPETLTMAEVLQRCGIDRIDFLKCDIEGSEFALFTSDAEWLRRTDRIAMEVHPAFGEVKALCQILEGHGFTVEVRDDNLTFSAPTNRGGYIYAHRVR